jgi:DNA-directed RNA polymerase subunit RPC12/RpoP
MLPVDAHGNEIIKGSTLDDVELDQSSEDENESHQSQPLNRKRSYSNIPNDNIPMANGHSSSQQQPQQSLEKKFRKDFEWVYVTGTPCHSSKQVQSGRDLSHLKKKYKNMKCMYCSEFNSSTPWARMKPRKFETDSLMDHEKSSHHQKAVDCRNRSMGLPVEAKPRGKSISSKGGTPKNNETGEVIDNENSNHSNHTLINSNNNNLNNVNIHNNNTHPGNPHSYMMHQFLHSQHGQSASSSMNPMHQSSFWPHMSGDLPMNPFDNQYKWSMDNNSNNPNNNHHNNNNINNNVPPVSHHSHHLSTYQGMTGPLPHLRPMNPGEFSSMQMVPRALLATMMTNHPPYNQPPMGMNQNQNSPYRFMYDYSSHSNQSHPGGPTTTISSPTGQQQQQQQLSHGAGIIAMMNSMGQPGYNQQQQQQQHHSHQQHQQAGSSDPQGNLHSGSLDENNHENNHNNNFGLSLGHSIYPFEHVPPPVVSPPSVGGGGGGGGDPQHSPGEEGESTAVAAAPKKRNHHHSRLSQSDDPGEFNTAAVAYQQRQSQEDIVHGDDFQRPKGRYSPPWLEIQGKFCYSDRQITCGQDLSRTKKKYRLVMCSYCRDYLPSTPWASMKPRKFETAVFLEHERSLNHKKAEEMKFGGAPLPERSESHHLDVLSSPSMMMSGGEGGIENTNDDQLELDNSPPLHHEVPRRADHQQQHHHHPFSSEGVENHGEGNSHGLVVDLHHEDFMNHNPHHYHHQPLLQQDPSSMHSYNDNDLHNNNNNSIINSSGYQHHSNSNEMGLMSLTHPQLHPHSQHQHHHNPAALETQDTSDSDRE